jgi:hypothetical protein
VKRTNSHSVEAKQVMTTHTKQIARHKTAIRRPSFSRPIACLLRDGLIDSSKTLFDYGCGHGQDLQLLSDMDIQCNGWDPMFRPAAKKQRANPGQRKHLRRQRSRYDSRLQGTADWF